LTDKLIAHIDGGSRGNPGPAASAFVLTDPQGKRIQAKAFFLGEATNNVAEYTALHRALEAAQSLDAEQIIVYSDSELLVRQINGQYKVKSDLIRPLFAESVAMLGLFKNWQVSHIPREKNKLADELVNKALDLGTDVEMKTETGKKAKPVRLGVLISGGGTTLMNLLDSIRKDQLSAEVAVVISSLSTAAGVEKAKAASLNVKIIRKKDYPDIDEFSKQLEQQLVEANVELVVQGGWLCLWKIPPHFENKVMNIHPALLPSFGGQGMWGHHVHEAVLRAGCKVSGCTVHFCTNDYDKGPIIVQRCCPVKEDDTPETLAARVFEQECIAYPEAIRLFAEGKLTVRDGVVKIKPVVKRQLV
jgi:phosphoribosylglycinamide formyltransferase-1